MIDYCNSCNSEHKEDCLQRFFTQEVECLIKRNTWTQFLATDFEEKRHARCEVFPAFMRS